jgi:hypothetical protein
MSAIGISSFLQGIGTIAMKKIGVNEGRKWILAKSF